MPSTLTRPSFPITCRPLARLPVCIRCSPEESGQPLPVRLLLADLATGLIVLGSMPQGGQLLLPERVGDDNIAFKRQSGDCQHPKTPCNTGSISPRHSTSPCNTPPNASSQRAGGLHPPPPPQQIKGPPPSPSHTHLSDGRPLQRFQRLLRAADLLCRRVVGGIGLGFRVF